MFPVLHGINAPNYVAPAALTYIGTTSSATNASSYTFTNHAIGTAAADRYVIVGVICDGYNKSGVTIGGNAATLISDYGDPGIIANVCFYALLVPSGTTATIVVNFVGNVWNCAIFVYNATGLVSVTPTAAVFNGTTASKNPLAGSLTIPAGGFCIAIGENIDYETYTVTWGGLTEDTDVPITTEARITCAHNSVSGLTNISLTWSAAPTISAFLAIAMR